MQKKLIPRESAENDIDPADSPLATDNLLDINGVCFPKFSSTESFLLMSFSKVSTLHEVS